VGTNDAVRFTTPAEWRIRIGRALETWNTRVRHGNLLLMVGIQPIRSISTFNGLAGQLADSLAMTLNEITDELAAPIDTVATTLLPSLGPESLTSLGRRTPEDYGVWAAEIAAELVSHLNASASSGERSRAVSDRLTAGVDDGDAVAEMLARDAVRLEHIVTMAAAGLHAPSAVVTVLGPDTQWHVARYGLEIESLPIEHSFCAVAVRNDDGMVVPDASHDPRFASNPLVTSKEVLYYAGVPIEDPEGRRVGALCVVDSRPRNVTTEAELSLLRVLAERVQQIVWESLRRTPLDATTGSAERRASAPTASAVSALPSPLAAAAAAL
jgi:GAF domain-containing protein